MQTFEEWRKRTWYCSENDPDYLVWKDEYDRANRYRDAFYAICIVVFAQFVTVAVLVLTGILTIGGC